MLQVATLVRSRNRSAVRFEAKQFSFKLQEKDEKSNQDVTFAKATVDLADYGKNAPVVNKRLKKIKKNQLS